MTRMNIWYIICLLYKQFQYKNRYTRFFSSSSLLSSIRRGGKLSEVAVATVLFFWYCIVAYLLFRVQNMWILFVVW